MISKSYKSIPLEIQHPYLLNQTLCAGGTDREQYPASRANCPELCNFLKT
jgi:hypothetical protein